MVASPIARRERDEVFLEATKSICPVCKVVLDAEVNVRDEKVYLRKRCREHGEFEALVYGDARMYLDSLRFNKPGTYPLQTQTEVVDGCPLDCGLCPDHKQHACIGLIEVNSNCNLDCPVCFADSGHQPDGFSLTMAQVESMIETFVAAEGEPEVLMFSGGEPSIHPQILAFIERAREAGIHHVVLNTNGIRLAKDERFAARLGELETAIYLQFDGLREDTHRALRGVDLRSVKERALERCADAGLSVSLVAAIERGVNDDELGDILRFGFRHPAVRSVVFQPTTHAGRHVEFDPLQRLTNADVIHGIVAQMPETFVMDDFFPVPCCFPTCRSVTYLLIDDDEVIPIPRLVDVEEHLDYLTNRVLPDPTIRGALERLWSASAVPGTTATAEQLACATCAIDLPEAARELTEKAFMVVIQDFQDPYTLNVKALMKCCVEQLTPDGRMIPFCAYNSVGYREEIREQLTGVAVPAAVPNATGLQPILEVSANGSPAWVKACCADLYGSDPVAQVLGPAFHPGGRDLTRRLARMACLRPGERVLDVASGPGGSAVLLAREFGVRVHGIDLSRDLVARATATAAGEGIDGLVTFTVGDAERLPVGTAAFDAVLCECALCTFPRKRRAVRELARAIAPGGRLMLSDIVVDRDRLPPELRTPLARVACIADALPLDGYLRLLEGSGLRICGLEQHDEAVVRMGQRIDARLALAASLRVGAGLDIAGIRRLVRLATRAAEDGIIGYAVLTAEPDRGRGTAAA